VIEALRTSILVPRDHLHIKHERASGRKLLCGAPCQIGSICVTQPMGFHRSADRAGGYARAGSASGGGGASRVPRIAGDVTAGSAHVSGVLVSCAACAERRRF
jgi:hypothetical protein